MTRESCVSQMKELDALRGDRKVLWKLFSIIIANWKSCVHLNKLRVQMASLWCWKCGEYEETACLISFNCPALQTQHNRSLVSLCREDRGDYQDRIVKNPEIWLNVRPCERSCTISYKSWAAITVCVTVALLPLSPKQTLLNTVQLIPLSVHYL